MPTDSVSEGLFIASVHPEIAVFDQHRRDQNHPASGIFCGREDLLSFWPSICSDYVFLDKPVPLASKCHHLVGMLFDSSGSFAPRYSE